MAIARNKRRIMLTVPAEVAEQLERLRQATGLATSGYLAQMLKASLPALQAMADAATLAAQKQDPNAALEGLRTVLGLAGTQLQLLNHQVNTELPKSPLGTGKRRGKGRPRPARRGAAKT